MTKPVSDKSTITFGFVFLVIGAICTFLVSTGIVSFKPAEAATAIVKNAEKLEDHEKRIQHLEDKEEFILQNTKETNELVKQMIRERNK